MMVIMLRLLLMVLQIILIIIGRLVDMILVAIWKLGH